MEQYRKSFRQAQKIVERDLCSTFAGQLKDLSSAVAKGTKQPADSIPTIVQRLGQLKRKYEESLKEQRHFCQKTFLRLTHLSDLSSSSSSSVTEVGDSKKVEKTIVDDETAALSPSSSSLPSSSSSTPSTSIYDSFRNWNKKMIDRLLADYMLRKGFFQTVEKMIGGNGLNEPISNSNNNNSFYFDYDLFQTSSVIERSLSGKSCTECLAWCNENKSTLRKKGSTLEFNLRLQEFIELVRQKRLKEAISYAKKYFSAWADTLMPQIQEAMALIAFPPFTKCEKYRVSVKYRVEREGS